MIEKQRGIPVRRKRCYGAGECMAAYATQKLSGILMLAALIRIFPGELPAASGKGEHASSCILPG